MTIIQPTSRKVNNRHETQVRGLGRDGMPKKKDYYSGDERNEAYTSESPYLEKREKNEKD